MYLPALIVIKPTGGFKDETTAINQTLQTDYTYLNIISV